MSEDESCGGNLERHSEEVQHTGQHTGNRITERHGTVDCQDHETSMLKEKVLQNLSFPAMNNGYSSIRRAHPGTYNWVFDTTEFQMWRSEAQTADRRRALWINGKPGAGKSTMMKHILDYCRKEMKDHAILSFFFNARGAPLESSMLGMLRSLVYQCIEQKTTLPKSLTQFLGRHRWQEKQHDWQWQIPELRDFFFLAVQQLLPNPVIILIDALDECEESGIEGIAPLLQKVLDLTAVSSVAIRACMASRAWPLFERMAYGDPGLRLNDRNFTDITVYIKESLVTVDELTIIETRRKAGGCFLWVIIAVDLLRQAYRAADNDAEIMQMRLRELPIALEGLFDALRSSSGRYTRLQNLLFGAVLFSRRLLRPEELFAAVGLVPADERSMRTRITKLSCGLVEVQQGDEPSAQFIHITAKHDLLLSDEAWQTRGPTVGHHGIWESCRDSIQQHKNDSRQGPVVVVDLHGVRRPFFRYALENVLYHAESVLSEGRQHVESIKHWLLNHSQWFDCLKQSLDIEREVELLYVLALDGLPNLAEIVLRRQGANVNKKGGLYDNALQAAVYRGNESVVRLLLRYGADVHAPEGFYGSALRAALYGGDALIIKLLLEVDAVGDGHANKYVGGLQAAVAISGDNEDLINRLLDQGTDINAQGGFYGNVLQVATLKGDQKVVRLLLCHGADIDAQGGFYGYALQAAAHTGNEAAVTLLLEAGANVDAEGGYYGTALQAAASQNHLTIVNDLVSRGANLNAYGGEYGNALCAASYEGNSGVVEFLLDKKADPDIQGNYYGTALQAAAYQGNLQIVQLLIQNGATIDTQGGEYGNALCAALVAAKDDIVKYILRNGASKDLRDSFNRTALHHAVMSGSHSMVQLLLKQGASPDR